MTQVVWSVNILIVIGLLGVIWWLYKILSLAANESKLSSNSNPHKTNHQ